MQTTFKEQIEAIQAMRKVTDEFYPELSKALNDAGSTIAAVQLAPCPEWVEIQVKKDKLI
jgi:hypothetical protein